MEASVALAVPTPLAASLSRFSLAFSLSLTHTPLLHLSLSSLSLVSPSSLSASSLPFLIKGTIAVSLHKSS